MCKPNPPNTDTIIPPSAKGNKEIAYLMQKGGFDTGKEAEKERLTNQVEQIIVQYPNSIYSSYFKPNLEKYKADEIRRKDNIERSKIKP